MGFSLSSLLGCGCLGRKTDRSNRVLDEESRLLPDSIAPEEPSVTITVESETQAEPQAIQDAKERLREKFSGIVRAKEGKMVDVSSFVPFNLTSGSQHSSSNSRSLSRSRNPHANVISPVAAVLPAQSDVIVQADAGGRSSSQVPPLRHNQADLTYSSIISNRPSSSRTNSNSDMAAIYAARRPSLVPSESENVLSSPRPPALHARLVGVGGINYGARRGRPRTKLSGYGGSTSSLSLGGTTSEGEGSHDGQGSRVQLPPPQAPSPSPIQATRPLPSQQPTLDLNDTEHRPAGGPSEPEGPLSHFAIHNTRSITIGWDD